MEIILLRHGNTFSAGEKVVWVGKTLDLPLSPSGVEQAKRCAGALAARRDKIEAVYCSVLQRTRVFAEIIIKELGLKLDPRVDPRLDELDYGAWSGLSKDEVVQKYGADELEAWERFSKWPKQAGWGGNEAQVMEEVRGFAGDLEADLNGSGKQALVVSSNGRLRYFLKLAAGEFERRVQSRSFSVKTGHIGRLVRQDGVYEVKGWNLSPDEFVEASAN
ncbi:MAG: histidine phosphatase family protein [Deltaproteobacteria bacterium]|nr:histidine phosphatase family protein [Deltaproteobacteria bacterium]